MLEDLIIKQKWVFEDLSRGIVNKLLYGFMQYLRLDGVDFKMVSEKIENMQVLERMFDLGFEVLVVELKIKGKK